MMTSYSNPILRGCLGGLIGGLLYLLTLPSLGFIIRTGKVFLVALIVIPVAAGIGGLVGFLIYLCSRLLDTHINAVVRAAVGTAFVLILTGLLSLIGAPGSYGAGEAGSDRHSPVVYWILVAVFFGVIPGVLARTQRARTESPGAI